MSLPRAARFDSCREFDDDRSRQTGGAQMTDYLSYVRDPAHGYLSVSFPESDGLEITCRL